MCYTSGFCCRFKNGNENDKCNKIQEKLYRPSLGAENTCNDSAKLPEESDAEVLSDGDGERFAE